MRQGADAEAHGSVQWSVYIGRANLEKEAQQQHVDARLLVPRAGFQFEHVTVRKRVPRDRLQGPSQNVLRVAPRC